jgi:hypothetical protein
MFHSDRKPLPPFSMQMGLFLHAGSGDTLSHYKIWEKCFTYINSNSVSCVTDSIKLSVTSRNVCCFYHIVAFNFDFEQQTNFRHSGTASPVPLQLLLLSAISMSIIAKSFPNCNRCGLVSFLYTWFLRIYLVISYSFQIRIREKKTIFLFSFKEIFWFQDCKTELTSFNLIIWEIFSFLELYTILLLWSGRFCTNWKRVRLSHKWKSKAIAVTDRVGL